MIESSTVPLFHPTAAAPLFADPEGAEYLTALFDSLCAEAAERLPGLSPELSREMSLVAEECAQGESRGLTGTQWDALWARYRGACGLVARRWNELASVSREYTSMEAFWEDADRQAAGLSDYTFWDTYEHGRRRQLESLFANAYGAESALLLNSGMSAVAVVIGSLNLSKGDVIVTGERCYFETSEYLEHFVAESGVRVHRVRMDDPNAVMEALKQFTPKLLLVETATNAHQPAVPRGFSMWPAAGPHTRIVVDNSVQSHATRWFEIRRQTGVPHLVIESAVKYLTHDCMAGVIYGDEVDLRQAREFARGTGQQLQEKAFNWIRPGEVRHAARRMLLHARNVRAFAEELHRSRRLAYVRLLDGMANGDRDAALLFRNGLGSLVFLSLDGSPDSAVLSGRHRAVVGRWKAIAADAGFEVSIRAGFGWTRTSGRAYEFNRLNQADAPSYLRVSVGIEPEQAVRHLAQLLVDAVESVTSETGGGQL